MIYHYTILTKFQRFWPDLDQDVLFGSGLCECLRHLSQRWWAIVGGSVGLHTINERITQIEPLLEQAQAPGLAVSIDSISHHKHNRVVHVFQKLVLEAESVKLPIRVSCIQHTIRDRCRAVKDRTAAQI